MPACTEASHAHHHQSNSRCRTGQATYGLLSCMHLTVQIGPSCCQSPSTQGRVQCMQLSGLSSKTQLDAAIGTGGSTAGTCRLHMRGVWAPWLCIHSLLHATQSGEAGLVAGRTLNAWPEVVFSMPAACLHEAATIWLLCCKTKSLC